ncbi:MAG: hypothetical protein AVDCRST_MAG45-737 [uncultured Solirubrobacterales bacterium]|uniref:Uncharacterized protein n=1 Tax=uncultured Solirubrobacterales bacterium TaxID=768556 RepID=A0A6J4SDL0_9ACTN|nr:MAG: hypothetical protein AVDCRST_MAG45-737 [uncultured Solirubrobacterales bacterium]
MLSSLAIVLLAVAGLLALLFLGGFAYSARRARRDRASGVHHIEAADRALERARATDRGWDRARLDRAARAALDAEHPGRIYDEPQLVLVDDRPGVSEDRAHLVATSEEGESRIVLRRRNDDWELETLD